MKLAILLQDAERDLGKVLCRLGTLRLIAQNNPGVPPVEKLAIARAVDGLQSAHCKLRDCDLLMDAYRDEKDQSYSTVTYDD